MRSNPYRNLYAALLRLYPRGYRQRFGEGMMQTFNDVCRDRVRVGESVLLFALWTFAETSAGIFREHLSSLSFLFMTKQVLRPVLITLLMLVIPFIGNRTVEGWNWDTFDFVFMGVLIFSAAFTFEMVARLSSNKMYKGAVGITVVAALLLTWMNLAVGIIGNEDNPANAMYFLVIPVGFLGLIASQMKAKGLSVTTFLMSAIVMATPCVALAVNRPSLDNLPGIFGVFFISAFYAALYLGAGLLFRNSEG